MDKERRGDFIQTYTGQKFWPLDPETSEIHIEDIAHALSNICRFTGHCDRFYSVAQHSVLVAEQCSPEHELWGLLHDAGEAYIGDMARPLKRFSGWGFAEGFCEVEDVLQKCVAERFGLCWPIPEEVHTADNRLLVTEARDLMGEPTWAKAIAVTGGLEALPYMIVPLTPKQAKAAFLEQFHTIQRRLAS